ncbi:MAG: alcohol dehydrogenase catalytic domain-containing protein [Candidatus Hydrogenedentes bacterium]|nr:alcohol dehydrogenase catalytic domain-containing protein [Candidatus Hydrogenedentota bacterium]
MKAAVITAPGVIEIQDVPRPSPGRGEVLLKVGASALCGTDQRVLRGEKPVSVKIIGHEIAGVVQEVGPGVTGIAPGERYAVQTVIGCGECPPCHRHHQIRCLKGFKAIGYAWDGGFAEYMIMPREGVEQGCLIPIPDDMSDEVATLLEPLSCCINGLRFFPFEEMKHVVILSGGIIGVLNGLVARAWGAETITIMNRSQGRLDLIRELGLHFDHLVNTSTTDPVAWVKEHTDGLGVDGVVAAASAKELIPLGMNLLALGGHLSLFAGVAKDDPFEPIDLNQIHYRELHLHGANSSVRRDYEEAIRLIETGLIDPMPLITHRFALDQFNEAFKTQADPAIQSLKVVLQH